MKQVLGKVGKAIGYPVKLSVGIVVLLILLSVLLTARITRSYPETLGLLKGPEILREEEEAFVAEVGRSISLPNDEKPTIATVSDITKLEQQPFFKNGREGDKVLMYTNAKKVILYRPAEKRVVEVGTLSINNQGGGEVAGIEVNLKFSILNGTAKTGVTDAVAKELQAAFPASEVITKANAAKKNYDKSLLVDLKGDREETAKELAAKLGLELASLPEGETQPKDVDFLIIVGADQVE